MNKPSKHLPQAILLVATIVTFWIVSRLLTLASPDLVLNFPYMWPDSFDWVSNAIYLLENFVLGIHSEPPSIRQPLFVVLIALAQILDCPGLPIVVIQLCFLLTLFFVYHIAKSLHLSFVSISLLLTALSFHHSLNSFRLYFMADTISSFLTVGSAYFYLRCLQIYTPKQPWNIISRRYYFLGAIVSGIASLTQIYGLYPSFAMFLIMIMLSEANRCRATFARAFPGLVTALGFQTAWMLFKFAHFGSFTATEIAHFSYFDFNLTNSAFYLNVWPIFFLPFLLSVLFLVPLFTREAGREDLHVPMLYFLIITVGFLVTTFFYQWQESRFTAFVLPFFGLTAMIFCECFIPANASFSTIKRAWAYLGISMIAYVSVTPTNNLMNPSFEAYWRNLFDHSERNSKSFLGEVAYRKKSNRILDSCLSKDQKRYIADKNCNSYTYPNIVRYLNFKGD